MIICEEAAAMDVNVFYEVVCPLLEMEVATLICISTLRGDQNFYSKLLHLKDENGKGAFVVKDFKLVCQREECKLNPYDCWHSIHMIPPWQTRGKHQKVQLLMSGRPDLWVRETRGVEVEEYEPVFDFGALKATIGDEKKDFDPLEEPLIDYVFIGVDPNGHGTSEYAMISVFFVGAKAVVSEFLLQSAFCNGWSR